MKDWGVVRIEENTPFTMPPTRRCLVCDKRENPDRYVVHEVGWLCPECKSRLRKTLYPKEERD